MTGVAISAAGLCICLSLYGVIHALNRIADAIEAMNPIPSQGTKEGAQ